ncbi:MAG: hypothetical protein ACTHL8_15130 [Burkholderiaceae bacterium]
MVFTVTVWETPAGAPLPATPAEADAQRRAARGRLRVVPPDARWIRLVRALLDRHPFKLAGDAGFEPVWADRHLLGDAPAPILALAVVARHADEVLPFVVATAGRLGLHVSEPRSRVTWLADGTIFAPDAGSAADAACMPARHAFLLGDHRGAWESLVELAEQGNRAAIVHLADMYRHGHHVMARPYVATALVAAAAGWRVVDGRGAAPADARPGDRLQRRVAEMRAGLAPDALALSDVLLQELLEPGGLRAALLQAHSQRERGYARGLAAVEAHDWAAAARELAEVAVLGHGPARRLLARMWAIRKAEADDAARELAWTREAAQHGDPLARMHLARLLAEGVLVPRDVAAACEHLRAVARTAPRPGLRADALRNLRRLAVPLSDADRAGAAQLAALAARAARGDGGPPDPVRAQALYVMAGRLGHEGPREGVEGVDPYAVRRVLRAIEQAQARGEAPAAVLRTSVSPATSSQAAATPAQAAATPAQASAAPLQSPATPVPPRPPAETVAAVPEEAFAETAPSASRPAPFAASSRSMRLAGTEAGEPADDPAHRRDHAPRARAALAALLRRVRRTRP